MIKCIQHNVYSRSDMSVQESVHNTLALLYNAKFVIEALTT